MSKLDLYKRPTVLFDASNSDHRKWYNHFVQHHTWGTCPVRFEVEDRDGMCKNLIVAMSKQVTAFYLKQEFKKKSYYKRKGGVDVKTIASAKQQEKSV